MQERTIGSWCFKSQDLFLCSSSHQGFRSLGEDKLIGALPELRVFTTVTMHYLGHCLVPVCFAKRPCCHTAWSKKDCFGNPCIYVFQNKTQSVFKGNTMRWVSIKDKNRRACSEQEFIAHFSGFRARSTLEQLSTLCQNLTWNGRMKQWLQQNMKKSHGHAITTPQSGCFCRGYGTWLLYTKELAHNKSILLDQKISTLQELK